MAARKKTSCGEATAVEKVCRPHRPSENTLDDSRVREVAIAGATAVSVEASHRVRLKSWQAPLRADSSVANVTA